MATKSNTVAFVATPESYKDTVLQSENIRVSILSCMYFDFNWIDCSKKGFTYKTHMVAEKDTMANGFLLHLFHIESHENANYW